MCNKQITFYKNNRRHFFFCGDIFRAILVIITALVVFNSCIDNIDQERSEIIKTDYPTLADEIIERDYDGLLRFTDHKNKTVRALAWKAIAKSEADDLNAFVDFAIQKDESLAWYALSLHPLSVAQVDSLADYFSNGTIHSESVCEVFFRKGHLKTLELLLGHPQLLQESENCAKAAGGILARVQVDDSIKRTVIEIVFKTDNETLRRNLLYGFFRSELNRPVFNSTLHNDLERFLDLHSHSFSFLMDEYIVRIAGKAGFMDVMERRSTGELNQAVQLSNELAKNVILFKPDELNHPYIKRLLNHQVNNVVVQALQSLQNFETIPKELVEMIEFEIAPITRDPEVFAEAMYLLLENDVDIHGYRTKLEFMDAQNEYLKHRMLPLFKEIESEEAYLNRIKREIQEGGIGGLNAVLALTEYYTENFQDKPEIMQDVKALVQFAVEEGDQSVISRLNSLLLNPKLFPQNDFGWMQDHYNNFIENSEWEKLQVFEEVLSNRFPDRFEVHEIPEEAFRIPNWDRLYEMGTHPFWVLETEKGTIEIQLDPLAAPFTVSSVDSLTRAGVYDDVPFHRVVRNFVIQGGDIDRKDGFGGPDYKLPTEPSFESFDRGAVGIASSGQGTEGSQFFVMLGWAPHLDGNYTIFGKVTKGMDVADRIQIGDRVIEARIDSR